MMRSPAFAFSAIASLTLSLITGMGLSPASAAEYSWDTPAELRLTSATKDSVSLEWDEVDGAPQYRIQLSKESDMADAVYYRVKDVSKTIEELDEDAIYYAKVRVISLEGDNLSAYSKEPVELSTAVTTPSGLRVDDSSATALSLNWNDVEGAPAYRIQLSTSSSMANSEYFRFSESVGTVTGLREGSRYFAKVKTITSDGANLSPYSDPAVPAATTALASTQAIPSSVGGLAAGNITSTGATISWNPVSTATRYRVYWSKSSSMPGSCEPNCKVITPASLTNPSQTLGQIMSPTQPTAGGTYYLKVSALNSAGKTITGWQATPLKVTLKTPATIPATVEDLAAGSITSDNATIFWKQVPTATRYRVYWSKSSSMPGSCEPNCKVITPASLPNPSQTLAQITAPTQPTAGGTYYLKVSALNASGKTITGWQATPFEVELPGTQNTPPAGLQFVSKSASTLTLDWNDVTDAPRYRVQLSKSPTMSDAVYYRFTDSEGVISDLEKSTTYYAKVKVITAEGDNLSAYSDAASGTTLAVDSVPLDVSNFNVKCQSCYPANASERGPGELPWVDRRQTVVNTIISRRPDVIGVQEASQAWLIENGKQVNKSQFEDLRDRLKAAGGTYELTSPHRNNCVNSTTPSSCVVKDQGASKGTKIYYNSAKMTLVRQGSSGLDRASSSGQERFVAWAVLRQKASGQEIFFATTHLEPGSTYYALRKTQAQQALTAITNANSGKLPIIMTGDLNSTRYATPTNAPYDVFVAGGGLVDPLGHTYKSPVVSPKATAEKRIHANYNSYNGFVPQMKRYAEDQNGSNLDYIFTSPMQVKEWETVVNVNAAGDLTGIIPSDHNMLTAEVVLPH